MASGMPPVHGYPICYCPSCLASRTQQMGYQQSLSQRYALDSQIVKKPKKKMNKSSIIYDPDYFDEDGVCIEHEHRECQTCLDESQASKASKAVSVVANAANVILPQTGVGKENFRKNVRFAQKVLGISQEELNKTKLTDLPKLMQKAQQEVTVGHMTDLMREDNTPLKGIRKFLKTII